MTARLERDADINLKIAYVLEHDATPDENVTEVQALDEAYEGAIYAYAALEPIARKNPVAAECYAKLDALCEAIEAQLVLAIEDAEQAIEDVKSDRRRR